MDTETFLDTRVVGEHVQNVGWIVFHDRMGFAACDVGAEILEQGLKRPSRVARAAGIEHLADVLSEDDRSRFELSLCRIVATSEIDHIGDSASQTVKRVHDRHLKLGEFVSFFDLKDKVCGRPLQPIVRNALHVRQEVDFDLVSIDHCVDFCTFGGVIVRSRDQDFAAYQAGQLLRGGCLSEIVKILGGVGAVVRQLGRVRVVALSPDIECLSADYKGAIRQCQSGRNPMDDISR